MEYAGAGINLRTDSPSPEKIRAAVRSILADPGWKNRAQQMQQDFPRQDPPQAAAEIVESVAGSRRTPA